MQLVVGGAIVRRTTGARRQQMNDLVFAEGQSDIGLVPVGSADRQNELATDEARFGLPMGGRSPGSLGQPETRDEDVHTAPLVDEVDRTPLGVGDVVRSDVGAVGVAALQRDQLFLQGADQAEILQRLVLVAGAQPDIDRQLHVVGPLRGIARGKLLARPILHRLAAGRLMACQTRR